MGLAGQRRFRGYRLSTLVWAATVLALMAPMPSARARDAREEGQVADLFESAFDEQRTPAERIKILEDLASNKADSEWADDALWAIGEFHHQARQYDEALTFKLRLVEQFPKCALGKFTLQTALYRKSPIPMTRRLLEKDGFIVYTNKLTFELMNPTPLVVHEQIARMYLAKKDYAKAASHYEKALSLCPQEQGLYPDLIRKNLEDAKRKAGIRDEPKPAPAP